MTNPIKNNMGLREWIMLISLSILWGGSFFFNGVAVSNVPTLTIVSLRVGIAAIALWIVAFSIGLKFPKSKQVWIAFFGMGLLNNVIPFFLIVWGQTQIASGLASILNATTPFFTVIVAGFLLIDERITSSKLIGVITGFFGVALMLGIPAIESSSDILAKIAIIGAALSYAFAGVFGRRFKTLRVSPLVTAAGQVTASSILLFPITLTIDGATSLLNLNFSAWSALFALAVLSTAVAYILYFKILESVGATNLLLVTLLIPVSAVLLGSIFLDEKLETIHYVGMLIIALGLSIIDGRIWVKRTVKNTNK